jgi:hypothetical protein
MPLISGGGGGGAAFNGGPITPTTDPGFEIDVPETTGDALAIRDTDTGGITSGIDPFGYLSGQGASFNDGGVDVEVVKVLAAASGRTRHVMRVLVDGANKLGVNPAGLVLMASLPTSDPHVVSALWNDTGTLKISAG